MRRTLIAAACLALLPFATIDTPARANEACAPAEHAGGEWRTFGPGLDNTRNQEAETTIGPLEAATLAPAWTFDSSTTEATGALTGTPVIADGCVFVGSAAGDVFALNADTGKLVWRAEVPSGGGVNSTVAVVNGRVHAFVSRVNEPYAVALDQQTGAVLWETVFDTQVGSDSYSSPVVYDGLVIAGVSGGAAELGDESDRYAFQGSYLLLDEVTGAIVHKEWVIHEPAADGIGDGYAGATVWSTPAVDESTGFAFVGTGNPFQPQKEHAHANAIIKIDLNRTLADGTANPAFGTIVDSYKGEVDEYFPQLSELPCGDIDGNPPPWYPQGVGACADIDLDFGAAPNIFTGASGETLVGAGQKAGVYHAVHPATMDGAWKQIVGPPGALGGIVGTAALTGHGIAGPVTPGGYLWSVATGDGAHQWASPTADAVHWGQQTSSANGVVYTVDTKGFLDAYDAATGVPLLHRSLSIGSDATMSAGSLGGGVAIARNTVYAPGNRYLVALRPSASGGGGTEPPDLPIDPPASAGTAVVSGPAAAAAGYATRAMVASRADGLTHVNADVVTHDVVSTQAGPADQPWCRSTGACPLLWSPLIGVGQTTVVRGLENAVPGTTYDFYCTLHPAMRGSLLVVD